MSGILHYTTLQHSCPILLDTMDTIDISQNIQDFKQVFENERRIIFSAKFGDGKSYFLHEFFIER